jgi:hypothetical protein
MSAARAILATRGARSPCPHGRARPVLSCRLQSGDHGAYMASPAENLPSRKRPCCPKRSSTVGPHGVDPGNIGPDLRAQRMGPGRAPHISWALAAQRHACISAASARAWARGPDDNGPAAKFSLRYSRIARVSQTQTAPSSRARTWAAGEICVFRRHLNNRLLKVGIAEGHHLFLNVRPRPSLRSTGGVLASPVARQLTAGEPPACAVHPKPFAAISPAPETAPMTDPSTSRRPDRPTHGSPRRCV